MGSNPRTRPLIGCAALSLRAIGTRYWLAWTERGLAEAHFCAPAAPFPGESPPPELPLPDAYAAVQRYFAGAIVDFSALPVDLSGTDFQLRVWEALRRIPHGRVRTYAGVATDIGAPRAMRAVGAANGKNPLPVVVPCHRVVQAGLALGGYSAGLDRKRYLLVLEGATLDGDQVQPGQLPLI